MRLVTFHFVGGPRDGEAHRMKLSKNHVAMFDDLDDTGCYRILTRSRTEAWWEWLDETDPRMDEPLIEAKA